MKVDSRASDSAIPRHADPVVDPLCQVSVGVGTLAGSTIMLLTIAWGGSLLCGRCDLNEQVRHSDTAHLPGTLPDCSLRAVPVPAGVARLIDGAVHMCKSTLWCMWRQHLKL